MADTDAQAQWLIRLTIARPGFFTEGSTTEEDEAIVRHADYLQQLAADGVVILAGPTMNEDPTRFGIVIFNAPDEAAARQIMESDPAISAGVMNGELFPFHAFVGG